MNKSDLVELKYLSQAQTTMTIWDLPAIVDIATTINKLNSITGILYFDQGYFGQILEGPRGAVEETWGRIQKDSRHCNIELLGITEIQERRFPKWSMRLFDSREFSDTFPEYAELIAEIDDPYKNTLEAMRSLCKSI